MQTATEEGFMNATLLAEYLVKKGLPFRKAHQIVGEIVNYCAKKHCQLEKLSFSEMQSFSSLINSDIYPLLDAKSIVAHQAKDLVLELGIRKQQQVETQNWVAEKLKLLNRVTDKLI